MLLVAPDQRDASTGHQACRRPAALSARAITVSSCVVLLRSTAAVSVLALSLAQLLIQWRLRRPRAVQSALLDMMLHIMNVPVYPCATHEYVEALWQTNNAASAGSACPRRGSQSLQDMCNEQKPHNTPFLAIAWRLVQAACNTLMSNLSLKISEPTLSCLQHMHAAAARPHAVTSL
jgi:hypothetical protein